MVISKKTIIFKDFRGVQNFPGEVQMLITIKIIISYNPAGAGASSSSEGPRQVWLAEGIADLTLDLQVLLS